MTWRVGDLAVCVKGGKLPQNTNGEHFPNEGEIYRVLDVQERLFEPNNLLLIGLLLDGAPQNTVGQPIWAAHRFRKVIKDGTTETEKTSIKDLLKTGVSA